MNRMFRNGKEKNNCHYRDCEAITDNLSRIKNKKRNVTARSAQVRTSKRSVMPILPAGKIQGIFELNKIIGRSLEKIFFKIFRDDSYFLFAEILGSKLSFCPRMTFSVLTLATLLSFSIISESWAVTCDEWSYEKDGKCYSCGNHGYIKCYWDKDENKKVITDCRSPYQLNSMGTKCVQSCANTYHGNCKVCSYDADENVTGCKFHNQNDGAYYCSDYTCDDESCTCNVCNAGSVKNNSGGCTECPSGSNYCIINDAGQAVACPSGATECHLDMKGNVIADKCSSGVLCGGSCYLSGICTNNQIDTTTDCSELFSGCGACTYDEDKNRAVCSFCNTTGTGPNDGKCSVNGANNKQPWGDCVPGTYKDSAGTCIEGTIANCANYSSDGTTCTKCFDNYTLKDNKCTCPGNDCPTEADCAEGEFLGVGNYSTSTTRSCRAKPSNCQKLTNIQGNFSYCETCHNGYYMNTLYQCVDEDGCGVNMYADSKTGKCEKKPDGCRNVDTNGKCDAHDEPCWGGYLEKDGDCISSSLGCGAGYKDMGGFCNRIRYTPAEAAAILNDDDNTITITFKK